MKHYVLSALAATMLVVPGVAAQAAPFAPPAKTAEVQLLKAKPGERVAEKKVTRKMVRKDRLGHKFENRHAVKHRWVRGHRVPHWQRQHVVPDYGYRGLRRPAPGQHWVKVNNDYLLIGIATGIIASVIAAN